MLRKVVFHGPLRKASAKPIEVHGNTVAECIEAVTRQLPFFKPDHRGYRSVQIVGRDTYESLHTPLGDQREIHVVPPVAFGKNGGLVQTIIGTALIVVGLFLPPGIIQTAVVSTGISMVIGGVIQMLAPVPKAPSNQEGSDILGAPGNTVDINTPIPLVFGRHLVQGQILSFDIDAADRGA